MKPPPFEYHRAYSALEASELLAQLGEDSKIIAGGQSLTPMMNFRLAHPSALVDVNHLADLDYVRRTGDTLHVGALTRHRTLETTHDAEVHDGFGLLPRAARWIGHYPIRTRGTLGGSIAHADGTAEWCLLAALFDAEVQLVSGRGERTVAIDSWFQGFLDNAAEADEVITEVRFRRPRSHGALTEFSRRAGDFAVVVVAVAFDLRDDVPHDVGLVLGGVGAEPLRVPVAEALAEGTRLTVATIEAVAEAAAAAPSTDDYHRHLIRTLVQRAFADAQAR